MTATGLETGTLHHVAPGSLQLMRNIRESKPSAELVASVKAVGILEPITARVGDDGALVVRFGHRRVLAALEAGLDTVPVYVAGRDDVDDDAEVMRIITQRDENTHRTHLTAAEEAGTIAQLAAFGLSASEISKKARVPSRDVDTALTVTSSELASKAAAKYEELTLDQVAAVAEFDGDPEVAKELIVTAIQQPTQFPHLLQRKRDARDHDRLKAEARERLTAEGVTVLDSSPSHNDRAKALWYLVDAQTDEEVTPANHADCPGRACTITIGSIYVDSDGNEYDEAEVEDLRDTRFTDAVEKARAAATAAGEDPDELDEDEIYDAIDLGLTETRAGLPHWYCLDPAKHGHRDRYTTHGTTRKPAEEMTDEEREKARQARALVIENNKAWDSAQTVRRDWIRDFAKVKTAPKGTAAFIANTLAHDRNCLTDYRVTGVVADLLGAKGPGHLDTHVTKLLTGASEARAQVIALVQILGSLEATLTQQSWRGNGTNSTAGRYLRFLETCGYALSDVEQYAISGKTA